MNSASKIHTAEGENLGGKRGKCWPCAGLLWGQWHRDSAWAF